jgi:Tol biopolymer transport system component
MEKIAAVGDNASWSADGRRLVFVRDDAQVWTMDADGGNQTQIASGFEPAFSPSGHRIVFAKNGSLWKVRRDGTDPERIVSGGASGYASGPIYLPNRRWIIFQGRPRGAARDGIWKIRPNGSQLRRLTAPPEPAPYEDYDDGLLDVSPGGGRILFLRCNTLERGCAPIRRWVMRPDGSGRRRVPISAQGYSPSGSRFVFATGEGDPIFGTSYCLDIHTVRPNGTDDRTLTQNCAGLAPGEYADLAYAPAWQPIPQP